MSRGVPMYFKKNHKHSVKKGKKIIKKRDVYSISSMYPLPMRIAISHGYILPALSEAAEIW